MMSREIKFRAYDNERHEYLSAGQIFLSVEPGSNPVSSKQYLDIISNPNAYIERFDIEQCIGRKDCNGKEIYEGDIVEVKTGYCGSSYYPEATYQLPVVYNSRRCCFQLYLPEMARIDLCNSDIYSLEIVGNIH